MGKKAEYFKGVIVPLLWWNGAEVIHSPRRLCNLPLMVWFGRTHRACGIARSRITERQKDSGSMPDSLSAGEFLKGSTALHDVVLVWCTWWQKLFFKKVTREQQIMGGAARVVLCGGSKIDCRKSISFQASSYFRPRDSKRRGCRLDWLPAVWKRQFPTPLCILPEKARRSPPQWSAEFRLLSFSVPHWLGPPRPRLLPRPSGAFSEKAGLCDVGVTSPRGIKDTARCADFSRSHPQGGKEEAI